MISKQTGWRAKILRKRGETIFTFMPSILLEKALTLRYLSRESKVGSYLGSPALEQREGRLYS